MTQTIKVLSIDGGGIRGIIPAVVLDEIEQRTGKPIADSFDLITGTSTGGIIALGLTKPGNDGRPAYSAADLLALYREEGPRIFSRSAWHKVTALGNLLEEKYPSGGVDTVLDEYFGETRLSEALTDVLITAYEIERRMPFFFKSRRAKQDAAYDHLMKQAARATSAAPTYFEPAQIDLPGGHDYFALIDGGVYANNPAMCAYAEARSMFPAATDMMVVSIGTGELTRRIPIEDAKGWGLALWAQPLLGVVFDGVSDTIDYQLQQVCRTEDGVRRYHRFQIALTEGSDDMDDTSTSNMRVLKQRGEEIARQQKDELDTVCRQLTATEISLTDDPTQPQAIRL
jgi:uncharacterized protein